jgi:O-antigen/teichoic acid export membrane protein
MSVETVESAPVSDNTHRSSFFRQSGWLMIATVAGGAFMWAVHFLSKAIPEAEYGQFGVFLAVAMCIPALPLQMVLAQQTAKAMALHREHELSGMIRFAWLGTFVIWLVGSGIVLLFQGTILEHWKITNPMALYLTLPVLLFTVWVPMFWGVLQGQQNFLWLGWSMMVQGVGRLGIAALAVLALHLYAAGMVTGMLAGLAISLIVAVWATRSLWLPTPVAFDWRGALGQVIPLTLGFGAYQFLLTADTMFVKACFNENTAAFYVSAGTLSRASMWLVGPLATVMFPKIVHARAKSQESDLVGIVLTGTLVLSAGGAMGLWVLGPWVVKFMFKASYIQAATAMLPWYAWAVVPLSVANVLLNNLLARGVFKVVPALCVLAVAYAIALTQFHSAPIIVIKTLGVFNTLLLAICAWYTWRQRGNGA